MIVADTNVTAYLMVAGNQTSAAQRLFEIDNLWVMPSVWPHEFLNVMATYAKAGGLQPARCLEIWRQAYDQFKRRIFPVNYDAALELAILNSISAYDAQFVQLASEWQIPLISEDRRLREKFPGVAVSIADYLS